MMRLSVSTIASTLATAGSYSVSLLMFHLTNFHENCVFKSFRAGDAAISAARNPVCNATLTIADQTVAECFAHTFLVLMTLNIR